MRTVSFCCGGSALVGYSPSGSAQQEKRRSPAARTTARSKRKSGSISEARIFRTRNGNLFLQAARGSERLAREEKERQKKELAQALAFAKEQERLAVTEKERAEEAENYARQQKEAARRLRRPCLDVGGASSSSPLRPRRFARSGNEREGEERGLPSADRRNRRQTSRKP